MKSVYHKFDQPELSIALISDTHGAISDDIVALCNTCDLVLHAGDVMDAQVLHRLTPRMQQIITVAGNNDANGLFCSEHNRYSPLPDRATVDLPGGRLVMEHGHQYGYSPCPTRMRDDHAQARALVCGHTHQQRVDQSALPWLLNPGAAGWERNRGGPSCLILHTHGDKWHVKPYQFSQPAGRQ